MNRFPVIPLFSRSAGTKTSVNGMRVRNIRGSALLEAALLVPIMLTMLFGTMDFGRVFYAAVAVASAARAGVQYGSLKVGNSGNFTAMKLAAQNDAASQGIPAASLVITARNFCQCVGDTSAIVYNSCTTTSCSTYGSAGKPPTYVDVTATYPFSTLVNWPGIPSTFSLTRTARMRVQ
jgi:Flp pilus assembly protein TadG